MCYTFGCKEVDMNHGDERHITEDTFKQAAAASNTSVYEIKKILFEQLEGDIRQAGALRRRRTNSRILARTY